MGKKLLCVVLAGCLPAAIYAFTDSLWIVGAEGYHGDLVTVELWLQYEGGGGEDMMSDFTIPLIWDATVCTALAVTIGPDFRNENWMNVSQIDNQGTQGPPAVSKMCVAAFLPGPVGSPGTRGTHLAATVDFRILNTASSADSTCFDTIMSGFTPLVELGFWDLAGMVKYIPSFSTDCIGVLSYTDSLWIVAGQGYPGDVVPVEVWLQYEGGGPGDSMSAFDIPLTWDATVCTVEAVTIAPRFRDWDGAEGRIDNRGTEGPPWIPKVGISAWDMWVCGLRPAPRGTHLAAILDVRILETAVPPESTCFDTLMTAFEPPFFIPLQFCDTHLETCYVPSFSTDCIRVIDYYCGDTNADGRITSADIVYLGNYIYRNAPEPYGEADVNLDGRVTVADAIYLGHYIYRRGPDPCNP